MSDDEEYTPCYCVHCTPGGELCPRCHPESRDGTVCVRLDGLADQIAAEIHDELLTCSHGPLGDDCRYITAKVVVLLQSLAVQ